MDSEWVIATLQDALAELDTVVTELDVSPEDAEAILEERMPAVFAKLNYAWNTRYEGAAALETHSHDALIAWPADIDFSGDADTDTDFDGDVDADVDGDFDGATEPTNN